MRLSGLPFHFWIECVAQSITDKVKRKNGKQDEKTCRNTKELFLEHGLVLVNSKGSENYKSDGRKHTYDDQK